MIYTSFRIHSLDADFFPRIPRRASFHHPFRRSTRIPLAGWYAFPINSKGCPPQIFRSISNAIVVRPTVPGFSQFLEIIVSQETAAIVAVEPVIQMNLIELRSQCFLPHFMSLGTKKR